MLRPIVTVLNLRCRREDVFGSYFVEQVYLLIYLFIYLFKIHCQIQFRIAKYVKSITHDKRLA